MRQTTGIFVALHLLTRPESIYNVYVCTDWIRIDRCRKLCMGAYRTTYMYVPYSSLSLPTYMGMNLRLSCTLLTLLCFALLHQLAIDTSTADGRLAKLP